MSPWSGLYLRHGYGIRIQQPRLGKSQPADPDTVGQHRLIGLVVMAMDNQPSATGGCQIIDNSMAVGMAGWRFVADQNVTSHGSQAAEVLGEDRVPVPQGQAASPRFARAQPRLERRTGGEGRRALIRLPDPRTEHTGQAGEPQAAERLDPKSKVAIMPDQVVECGFRLGV